MLAQFGKILVVIGSVLLISGILVIFLGRFLNLDSLPGTIRIQSGSFRLVIPILASILLSILLTVILNIVVRLINR